MVFESYYGAHNENVEIYKYYEKELSEISDIEKVESVSYIEYRVLNDISVVSNNPIRFYFQIREELGYYLLTDNGDNYGGYTFSDDEKESIETYLSGSGVGINFENDLNLVYLKLGTLDEDFNISFLAKKYIDAITYINSILED